MHDEMHKWLNPFMAAKKQFAVDKWNMSLKPYDHVLDGTANVNIINITKNDEAADKADWKLRMLEKVEQKQYAEVKEYLNKKKILKE